jgi:AbrB family looped-hinge helix DNA binding protein
MKITAKGQVTVPQDIRERFGLMPNTEVEFAVLGDRVYLRKISGKARRGEALVAHLRGRATVRMSTDEIMALTRAE